MNQRISRITVRLLWALGAIGSATLCLAVLLPFGTMGIFNVGSAAVLIVFVPATAICLFPHKAGALRAKLRRRRCGRILLRAVAVFLIVLALYCAGMTGLMISACAQRVPDGAEPPLVVLGCQVYPDGPSPMLAQRLKRALVYLDAHPNAVCVVSGGTGSNEHLSEAAVMRDWLIAHGVAAERIRTEDRSTNTEENIRFSLELLAEEGTDVSALAICTDWWHELRGRIWTERAGVSYYSVPCATYAPLLVVYYARELCGTVRMVLLGY